MPSLFPSRSFTYVGERVGNQLLKTAYEAILRLPISWFDNPKNEVTEVIQIILNDVAQVKLVSEQLFQIARRFKFDVPAR